MKYKFIYKVCLALFVLLGNCYTLPSPKGSPQKPEDSYPDYSDLNNWIALPSRQDHADKTPTKEMQDEQSLASGDVLYIYPTTLLEGERWNADLKDERLNKKTGIRVVRSQASIFNKCCRVYAPKYRQAIITAFFKENDNTKESLELAYSDVRKAYLYYMKELNKGRPYILAGHSQGAFHLIRLLKEEVGKEVNRKNFVVAYLVGMPVKEKEFSEIPICKDANQTSCFVSWNTYGKGSRPGYFPERFEGSSCVNPLSWKVDEEFVSSEHNMGGINNSFQFYPKAVGAGCKKGILEISKPNIPKLTVLAGNNYHVVDMHLFYSNIRDNANIRVKSFLKKK